MSCLFYSVESSLAGELITRILEGEITLFIRRKLKATERSRTADLLITNQLLYQLSYGGE